MSFLPEICAADEAYLSIEKSASFLRVSESRRKPLIPKSIFIAVFGFTCLLTIYLSIYGETTPESWLNFINYEKLFNTRLLKGFTISTISMYAIVASTVMFCIQIGFLRNSTQTIILVTMK